MGLFSGLAEGWEKAKRREKGVRKSIRKSARKSLRRSTVKKEVQATTTQVAATEGRTIDEQLTATATEPGDIELGGVTDKGKGSDEKDDEEVVRHTMNLLSNADKELATSEDFDSPWSDLSWKERRARLETLGLAKDPAQAPGREKVNASAAAKRTFSMKWREAQNEKVAQAAEDDCFGEDDCPALNDCCIRVEDACCCCCPEPSNDGSESPAEKFGSCLVLCSLATCCAGGLTFGFVMLAWWCYNRGFPEPPVQPAAPPPLPYLGLNAPNAPPGTPFAEVEYEPVWWWWRYALLWIGESGALLFGLGWCYLMLMACGCSDVD